MDAFVGRDERDTVVLGGGDKETIGRVAMRPIHRPGQCRDGRLDGHDGYP